MVLILWGSTWEEECQALSLKKAHPQRPEVTSPCLGQLGSGVGEGKSHKPRTKDSCKKCQHPTVECRCMYRNFRTISRDFFPQLLTLRLKQRMRLIYGFFSIRGASHTRLFLASFQLASKRRAAIRTCLCTVMFISKVSQKFISIFKYSVE